MKRNRDKHILNHIKGREKCFGGMAQFENITQTMQVQNPILAYYVNVYMYKIQSSASMKKKVHHSLRNTDLFQSWTVTRLGPNPDRLVFETSLPLLVLNCLNLVEIT